MSAWLLAWPRLAFACAVLGLVPLAAARSEAGASNPDARTPEQWLQLIQRAARQLNYSGTIVYQSGADVRFSRVVHFFDGAIAHERLVPLDGTPREFIRRADEVRCLLPEKKRVVVERGARGPGFPTLAAMAPAKVLEQYTIALKERDRIAGRDCQVIELTPVRDDRYGYRLWVDRESGLLLRSQTLDANGAVLEHMAFAEVSIGSAVQRDQLKPAWSIEGWKVVEKARRPAELMDLGWQLSLPAGFTKVYSGQRAQGPGGGGATVQAVFSDGLASLSVFIEQAGENAPAEAQNTHGPTNAFARRLGPNLITVVGELPPATVRTVAYGVEPVRR